MEWRDIKDFEGVYQVSSTGLVKRLEVCRINRNQHSCWEQKYPERIFTPSKDSKGYLQVTLKIGNIKRTARVHRLVAECFLRPASAELVTECERAGLSYVLVNHINGIKTDNRIENLEWCSPAHNLQQAIKDGKKIYKKGVDVYNCKLTEEDVLKIYALSKDKIMSQASIADMYNIKQITVSNIKTGKSWNWLTGENNTRNKYGIETKAISEQLT